MQAFDFVRISKNTKSTVSENEGVLDGTLVVDKFRAVVPDNNIIINNRHYLFIYLLIIHTKVTIECNAQYILTQYNIKAKALNATHGRKLNC